MMMIINLDDYFQSGTFHQAFCICRHLGELKFKQKGREEQCEPDNPTQAKKVITIAMIMMIVMMTMMMVMVMMIAVMMVMVVMMTMIAIMTKSNVSLITPLRLKR